jgi:hypothetical protein
MALFPWKLFIFCEPDEVEQEELEETKNADQ